MGSMLTRDVVRETRFVRDALRDVAAKMGGERVSGVIRSYEAAVSADPVLPCRDRLGERDSDAEERGGGRHRSHTRSFARDLAPLLPTRTTEAFCEEWVEQKIRPQSRQ